MESRVLFICTGNYYRSRFAEAVFNHHAESLGLPYRAFSRGLAIHYLPAEFVLSPHTQQFLTARNMDVRHTAPDRRQLSARDLEEAEVIIALKDDEHRPMMRTKFPGWEDRVVYWNVGDQPEVAPDDGLPAIERQVVGLIEELQAPAQPGTNYSRRSPFMASSVERT
jgi:protein-tyrosine phosphatase